MAEFNFSGKISRILDVIFPPRCPGCGKVIWINTTDAFCPECREKWEKHKKEKCRKCGQPIDKCWCGVPLDSRGVIAREYHLVQYDKTPDTVIKNLLYNMKYYDRKLVADTVAQEMLKEFCSRIEYRNVVISYVPRSPSNIKRYGHDQSLNIARSLSALTGYEIADVLFHAGTVDQKGLSTRLREKNAKRSYRIINGAGALVKNKTVILVDDVLTTGSSVTRCAHLLKWKGTERVIVFTIAKTIE